MAQNDTSKTANITDTMFDRTYWYSPYKRRRFENRSDQTFCILLIKYVLSVNLHSVTGPIAYYYVAHYVWPYHETVRMSVCPSVCHVSYLENGAR